jgi:hypothetical protein
MKPIAIPDPRNPAFAAQDPGFKILFGLSPKAKWPVEGINNSDGSTKDVYVDGSFGRVQLWVQPLVPGSKPHHRLMACCPRCRATMTAGRLQQHMVVHGG